MASPPEEIDNTVALIQALIPLGLHHIPNSYIWFLYGDYQTPSGKTVTGELTRFAAGDPTGGHLTAGFWHPTTVTGPSTSGT